MRTFFELQEITLDEHGYMRITGNVLHKNKRWKFMDGQRFNLVENITDAKIFVPVIQLRFVICQIVYQEKK